MTAEYKHHTRGYTHAPADNVSTARPPEVPCCTTRRLYSSGEHLPEHRVRRHAAEPQPAPPAQPRAPPAPAPAATAATPPANLVATAWFPCSAGPTQTWQMQRLHPAHTHGGRGCKHERYTFVACPRNPAACLLGDLWNFSITATCRSSAAPGCGIDARCRGRLSGLQRRRSFSPGLRQSLIGGGGLCLQLSNAGFEFWDAVGLRLQRLGSAGDLLHNRLRDAHSMRRAVWLTRRAKQM